MQSFAAQMRDVSLELGTQLVLDRVSLDVPAGRLTAIVGPNGCGKSTLARMLSGFLHPTSGTVTILGKRLGQLNVHELRRQVKLVQPSLVYEPDPLLKVRDVILTGAFGTIDLHDAPTAHQRDRADALVDQLALTRVAGSNFHHCSSGERMRTQLARALMSFPALLLLDEPTAGLDLPAREQLLVTLDAIIAGPHPPAVVVITHHVEELPAGTGQVILMSLGKVVKAGPADAVLRSEVMSDAFGFPITVTHHDRRYYARAATASVHAIS